MNRLNLFLTNRSVEKSLSAKRIGAQLAVAAIVASSLIACEDWGEKDPPAGGQIYPRLAAVNTLPFNDVTEFETSNTFVVQEDDTLGFVLALNGSTFKVANELEHVESGVGVTLWAKEMTVEANSLLFAFANNADLTGKYVGVNAAGQLVVDGAVRADAQGVDTLLISGKWRYIAADISATGYKLYSDGNLVYESTQDLTDVLNEMVASAYFYIGAGNTTEYLVDNVTIYRNTITSKEVARPAVKIKGDDGGNTSKDPIYFNDFENGAGDATIFGNGALEDKGGVWGSVFSNALNGMRANYLVLPEDVLTHSAESKALTIGVWVNRGNETESSHYMWSPLFTAYGSQQSNDNTWPMLACQYRGVLQVNCTTWSDYVDTENVDGKNHVYHDATDWIADGEWHYYTATFTETTANVYFDGNLVNSWVLDGERSAAGLFSNGFDLKWICLGGNQAWNWGDPDPGFWFDDIAIYNVELTPEDINAIITRKMTPNPQSEAVYFNNFENGVGNATIFGNGTIEDKGGVWGSVFSNALNGMRENYLVLPEDVFTHSTESKALTIGVWVNRGNETESSHYMWSPLFTAYGSQQSKDNTWPMIACQYRGVLQVNCTTWSDYVDTENVDGKNHVYHDATDWIADGEWHYYTATFTETTAKVYFDGNLVNSWVLDGERSAAGLFSNGADLKWVCLGGNQAWNWGDPDPGFWFDDIAIWNKELSEETINEIISLKK